MSIKSNIASAIKRADKSYFFENYSKQAGAVIKMLEKEGYVILPKNPDQKILKEVADTIKTGKMRPEQHIENVYHTLAGLMKRELR